MNVGPFNINLSFKARFWHENILFQITLNISGVYEIIILTKESFSYMILGLALCYITLDWFVSFNSDDINIIKSWPRKTPVSTLQ